MDDRSLSLTGLTYIPLLNRKRERVIGRYTFAARSTLFLDSVFCGQYRAGRAWSFSFLQFVLKSCCHPELMRQALSQDHHDLCH